MLQTGLHAAVGRRGELRYLVVKFLIGPVLCDVIQVAVEVHQQRVIAGVQHLTGDRPSLLPLSQHDPEHSEETKTEEIKRSVDSGGLFG